MKPYIKLIIFVPLLFFECSPISEKEDRNSDLALHNKRDSIEESSLVAEEVKLNEFKDVKFHSAFHYPTLWKVASRGDSVLNIYKASYGEQVSLPLMVKKDFKTTYVAFLPKGLMGEVPNGSYIDLTDWNASLVAGFSIDNEKSKVYMLNDGTPWAYLLKPLYPPKNWNDEGVIYIQMAIEGHYCKCFNKKGKEKIVDECNIVKGDKLARYGNVNENDKKAIDEILESIYFFEGQRGKRMDISNLITVDYPQPSDEVKFPLTIKGKARGYWFNDGSFMVELQNSKHKAIEAWPVNSNKRWKTNGWVPFQVTVDYGIYNFNEGALVFKRSNPTGSPNNDRNLRIPIHFSDERVSDLEL